MKDLMLQALNEMDKIFYNSIDEKMTPTQKAKAEEQWDFCYEKLETMIKAMEEQYYVCIVRFWRSKR